MIISDFTQTAEQIQARLIWIIEDCMALKRLLDVCFTDKNSEPQLWEQNPDNRAD